MKNIWMLALAPIRKNKEQSVSLLVFALITMMILNIGLVLFFGVGKFFDERAEANHAPHFTGVYHFGTAAAEQGQRFMETDARISEMERIQAVGGYGEYVVNDVVAFNTLIFSRLSKTQKMDAPSFIGEHLPLTGDRIYIPYYFLLNGGFNVGDDIKLTIAETELYFTIAGVTEEISFGTQMGFAFRFYISDEKCNEMESRFPDNDLTILSVRLHDGTDTVLFQTDYNKKVSSDGLFYAFGYETAKESRTMIPTIIAIIITAFALILLLVSLIVIRFRIINGIEENMINIGAQKAVGYKSSQIITANVTQYGLVAMSGGLIGAVLAEFVIPVITKIFEPLLALSWNPGINISTSLISILLVLMTVALIAFTTSGKIRKLHPLIALRGGTTTHSFRKNAFPLDKSRGTLNLLLALKQIVQSKKQTITICVIVAAVTMAAVAGIAVNYSMNDGRDAFARSMFGELIAADVIFGISNGDDGEAFRKSVTDDPDVRKVLGWKASAMYPLVDNIKTWTVVAEDCSQLEGSMLIEGYYPRHDNEVALGPAMIKATDKGIGDTVTIQLDDHKSDYIITGIIQFSEAGGFVGLLNVEGVRNIVPDFTFAEFNIYLNEGANVKAFIERVKAEHGDILTNTFDTQEQMAVSLDSLGGMFAAVAYGILAVTVFVVVLTLYMVIKTIVLRRRRELGIQKAVGFTTLQLMNQIALNMTPVILLGILAGAVAGCFGFNPLMSALLSSSGMAKLNLPIPIDQFIVVCIALVVLAYAVSMLVAWRIRKISAYALVSE